MSKELFREDEIKKHIEVGYKWREICEIVSCNMSNVNRVAKKYGLSSKKRVVLTDEQEKDVINMYIRKIPITEICDKFGVHRCTIQNVLKRNKISPKNYNVIFTKEDENFLIEHYSLRGSNFCSRYLNFTRRQISRKASLLKLKKETTKDDRSMRNSLRGRLVRIIRCNEMSDYTKELVGCDKEFFKDYIESLFIHGMNWGNYGTVWELDHITPVSYFNIFDEAHKKLICNYKNIRPLWSTTLIAREHKDFTQIGNRNKSNNLIDIPPI